MCTAFESEAYLHGALAVSAHGDLIAVALNERFSELGRERAIPSTDDENNTDW